MDCSIPPINIYSDILAMSMKLHRLHDFHFDFFFWVSRDETQRLCTLGMCPTTEPHCLAHFYFLTPKIGHLFFINFITINNATMNIFLLILFL